MNDPEVKQNNKQNVRIIFHLRFMHQLIKKITKGIYFLIFNNLRNRKNRRTKSTLSERHGHGND